MRLWRYHVLNWVADGILSLGVGMTAIAAVLLGSDMLMDLTGHK